MTVRNADQDNKSRAQSRKQDLSNDLIRIRDAARRDRKAKFISLLHHVSVERLEAAYRKLNRKAAPGVDGVTWKEYGRNLEANLEDLHGRIHRGAYRAKPSLRAYVDKPDGGQRPLGKPALEDKIAQTAVGEVLSALYEVDFADFSYGFREKRSPHQALDALAYAIKRKKVNWVLDADICGYFDSIDHETMGSVLEHRIGDRRVLRLLRKWLNAGVLEEEEWKRPTEGTPQGACISPLLANVYLHYALDSWVLTWRQANARGEVEIVRYADDFVMGFQYKDDAERFLRDLHTRLETFHLKLHPEKTRLIEFGRFARRNRKARGEGKPESFVFLGFCHICSESRKGTFLLRRHTCPKRLRSKIKEIRGQLHKRMHLAMVHNGVWLRKVITGYDGYFAVPTNRRPMERFRKELAKAWLAALRRRSDKDPTTWKWLVPRLQRWIPPFEYRHPWPDERYAATHSS